jgi:hypothetical protein
MFGWFGFVVFLYHDLSDFNDIFCWFGFVVVWDIFCWFGFVVFTTLGRFTTLRAQNVPLWSGPGRGTWLSGRPRSLNALGRASPGRGARFAEQAQGAERALPGGPRARNVLCRAVPGRGTRFAGQAGTGFAKQLADGVDFGNFIVENRRQAQGAERALPGRPRARNVLCRAGPAPEGGLREWGAILEKVRGKIAQGEAQKGQALIVSEGTVPSDDGHS